MKSQVTFLLRVLHDAFAPLGLPEHRDREEIILRFKNHGQWFLEAQLPMLDDGLLKGLSTGTLEPIKGWKGKRKSPLPEFLYGLWSRIFSANGSLLENPCTHSIICIRQISRTYKKVFEVCADKYIGDAIDSFVSDDESLSKVTYSWKWDEYREISQILFSSILGDVVTEYPEHVKHGPGAVAEGHDSVARWEFSNLPDRILEEVDLSTFTGIWDDGMNLTDREIPARLVTVPKTALKPRLISIEPSYNQFVQQGMQAVLRKGLRRYPGLSYDTQLHNREWARLGSISGELATLDLSSASDLVSDDLLAHMFGFNRAYVRLYRACRSERVELPDGSILELNKAASMGSAVTFPHEIMYFAVLCVRAICQYERNFTKRFITALVKRPQIRIYGDDIIVPTKYADVVIAELESVGLRVNQEKSFTQGHFRESCGGDYYKGTNVTPKYSRRRMPTSQRDVSELVSLVSLRNQLHDMHIYPTAVQFLDGLIRKYLPDIRVGNADESEDLVLVGPASPPERYNKRLQRAESRGYVIANKRKRASASDLAVLRKSLSSVGREGPFDDMRLTHHTRPTSLYLKRRWVPSI